MRYPASLSLIVLLVISGCSNKPDNRSTPSLKSDEGLIEMNKSLIAKDRELITIFTERMQLKATESPTGLWFYEMKRGEGKEVKTGDNVMFDFECTLLNGTPCYSGTKSLRVGYNDAGSGVTEGLQMMRQGSEFLFIIPPYLAYGLTGDGNKIPGRSILIYKIRVREII